MTTESAIGSTPARRLALHVAAALAALSCSLPAAAVEISFTDIALEAGVQDRLAHGRGQVVADFDGNGWVDFFNINPGPSNRSFILWNQGPDIDGMVQFVDGPTLVLGQIPFNGTIADYDNDGDPDLFVGNGGQEGIGLDFFFRNDGGTFTDISATAGIQGPINPTNGQPIPVATTAGVWSDYDKDGDLDLFTSAMSVRETLPLPQNFGMRKSLFRNNGDGTFTDVTSRAGLLAGEGLSQSTKTSSWGDYDNDGWPDLFVPHEDFPGFPQLYQFFRNNQDGTFTEVTIDEAALGIGRRAFWASSAADFNNDGLLDVLVFSKRVGPINDPHTLLINQGDWTFSSEGVSSGLSPVGSLTPFVMGSQVGDVDNDGYPDVVMGNGGPLVGEIDKLFLNRYTAEDGVVFEDASHLIDFPAPNDPDCVEPVTTAKRSEDAPRYVNHANMSVGHAADGVSVDSRIASTRGASECTPPYPYRGHAINLLDVDRDGDIDISMSKGGTEIVMPDVPSREPNRLFRNDGGNLNHWLALDLVGTVSNRDAIGARIQVTSRTGAGASRKVFQEVKAGSAFGAGGPGEVHIGLGTDDTIEELRIEWPSGMVSTIANQPVDQRLTISEDTVAASNFNDGTADSWTVVSGNWNVNQKRYLQSGSGDAVAVTAGAAPSDSTAVAKITYLGGATPSIGLLGRVNVDATGWYGVILSGSQARLIRKDNGVLTPLGSAVTIEPMQVGRSYIVRLNFAGDTIRFAVDGKESGAIVDATHTAGRVGLRAVSTLTAFDNVAVY